MGIKMDAVPGRLNQFIAMVCRPGIFYGQCSELCGVAHGFMPIGVAAVPYDSYEYWLLDPREIQIKLIIDFLAATNDQKFGKLNFYDKFMLNYVMANDLMANNRFV